MLEHFEIAAAYNRWANARLYEAAFELGEDLYRRDIGLFFSSIHGTFNHLLLTDRIWLKRLTGVGEHPDTLDAILFDQRRDLALARVAEDDRLIVYVTTLQPEDVDGMHSYRTTSGAEHSQRRRDILAHLLNHQTHHRGQVHTALSILTGVEPPSVDLLQMQRGAAAPDLRRIAERQQT